MYFFMITVSAVELNCLFTLRDLEKLESGANIPVYSKLRPFAFDLKTKIGLENIPEKQTLFYRAWYGNTDSIHTFIIRWIESRNPKIEHTWMNLILLLEEFGEKMFANQLKHYLTFPPECVAVKETGMEELSRFLKLICIRSPRASFLNVACIALHVHKSYLAFCFILSLKGIYLRSVVCSVVCVLVCACVYVCILYVQQSWASNRFNYFLISDVVTLSKSLYTHCYRCKMGTWLRLEWQKGEGGEKTK